MTFKMFRNPQIVCSYQDKYGATYGFLRQGFECRPYVSFDENDVVILDYSQYAYVKELSIQYNIASIGEYALEQAFLFAKTGGQHYFQGFMRQVDWLIENRQERPGGVCWLMEYDYVDVKSPWVSGMVNGLALSCLTKAYIYTGRQNYLELAAEAMKFYEVLVQEGGFTQRLDGNQLFFQEYTNCADWRRFALNGFLLSILGLLDYKRIVKESAADQLITGALNFLKSNVDRWEHKGVWTSLYFAESGLSKSIDYHTFHTELMFCLYVMTEDEDLFQIYRRWAGVETSVMCELIEGFAGGGEIDLKSNLVAYLFKITGIPELRPLPPQSVELRLRNIADQVSSSIRTCFRK